MLPNLYQEKRYRGFYRKRSEEGDFIILDNGAAESFEFGHKHLHTMADSMGVREIVVPDTLYDPEDTLDKARAFSRHASKDYQYMVVAQGRTAEDCIRSIQVIARTPRLEYVTTLGIPRLLNESDRFARQRVSEFLAATDFQYMYQYHYLGAGQWFDEVGYLDAVGVGRGIDTSAPIYMGQNGYTLQKGNRYKKRPSTFFTSTIDKPQIKQNIDTYLDWANAS